MERRLIEEIRKRPCIYDNEVEDYRHTDRKENAWREVASILDTNTEQVKRYWKKLRDCFRQALARRKAVVGQVGINLLPWKYENDMEFLTPFMKTRQKSSSVFTGGEVREYVEPEGLDLCDIEEDIETSIMTEPMNEKRKGPCKKKIDSGDVDKVITFLRERRREKPDDLDYFFASVCEATRRLPRRMQNQVKREILDTVARAEEQFECETMDPLYVPSPTPSCSTTHSSYTNTGTQDPLPLAACGKIDDLEDPAYGSDARFPDPCCRPKAMQSQGNEKSGNESDDEDKPKTEEREAEELRRAREWDDHKDTHRRGWGNRYNRS